MNMHAEGVRESEQPRVTLQERVRIALPLLCLLRDERLIVEAVSPRVPDAVIRVEPYYMNRSDPYAMGMWQVTAGHLQARITSQPTIEGVAVTATTVSQGEVRELTDKESHHLNLILQEVYDLGIKTLRKEATHG